MKYYKTKTFVVCFIILIILSMLFAAFSCMAYADSCHNQAQDYIDQPASAVLQDYGYPETWRYHNYGEFFRIDEECWYYTLSNGANIVFYIHFSDSEGIGIVTGFDIET